MAGRFEDQKLSLSSQKPVQSILNEPCLPTSSARNAHRVPKCALFDTFTLSGCGANYSPCMTSPGIGPDLASRSAPRLAFLRVEVEHQQIASSGVTITPTTHNKKRHTSSGWLEILNAVCLECLPRAWYDRHLLKSRYYCVKVRSYLRIEGAPLSMSY